MRCELAQEGDRPEKGGQPGGGEGRAGDEMLPGRLSLDTSEEEEQEPPVEASKGANHLTFAGTRQTVGAGTS